MKPQRFFGTVILVGAVVTLIGNVAHSIIPLFDIDAYAQEAGGPVWAAIHGALLSGIVVLTLGFIHVYGVLRSRGDAVYSLVGLYAILLAMVMWSFVLILDGFAGPRFAADYRVATGTTRDTLRELLSFQLGIVVNFLVFAFLLTAVSAAFFGASMLRARTFHPAVAAFGILVGLVIVLGYAAGLFGNYFVGNPVFTPLAGAVIVWTILVGISLALSREALQASRPSA